MSEICWISLCKNEMDILPFVKQYWEHMNADVVVYDNGSTDGSIEYLSKLPYVTVKHFDSDGHNDVIQKQVKEQAYLELKDKYDIVIITDMDEVFYFNDFKAVEAQMINGGYNCTITTIYSLCEDSRPIYDDSKLLHEQCHKFYKQRMNHMQGFYECSKVSIFNTKITSKVDMSVGQHYVQTSPTMKLMFADDGFCLHIDKGLSEDYYVSRRKKMGDNLSELNKKCGMGIEYLKSEDEHRKEYRENQSKSFDINLYLKK